MYTIRVFYVIYAIFNLFDLTIRTHPSKSHRPFFAPRSFPTRSLAWLTGSLTISCFFIFLSGCGVLSRKGSLETKSPDTGDSLSASVQTTTSCGQTTQTGVDSQDAFWQLGTPCTTGTNTGGYTVSSISYWVGTPVSASFDLGVYSSSSGTPSSLLCSVSTGTITPSSGWNSVNISNCPTLSASTTYWVGYITGSNQIEQGTVSGNCPGASNHSTWANARLSGVSLANPFPANTQASTCYSLYVTLHPAVAGQAQAQAHQVNLTWDAAKGSSDLIVGYEIYRSTSGNAQYQLLNLSVGAQTNFTDSNVQSGVTYWYYVIAVDSSGAQSPPSNINEVSIP